MDFASRFLGGYGQGRADKQQADAQAKQEKINMLLGQAYADPSQRDASLAQAAPLDFGAVVQAEQAFGSRDDRINKGRANLSRTFLAMPPEGRARFAQQFGQDFQRLGLDPNAPDFEQIATGYAAMEGAGSKPAAVQVFEAQAAAAGLRPGSPEYQKAAQIALGLEGRASSAGFTFDTVDDNGVPRPQRRSGRGGGVEMYIAETGQWQQLGGGPQAPQGAPQPAPAGPGSPAPVAPEAVQADMMVLSRMFGVQPSSLQRDPAKNAEVGGVPNSQHIAGTAGDFPVPPEQKQQFISVARQLGYEAIDEGDHVHLELPSQRGGQPTMTPASNVSPPARPWVSINDYGGGVIPPPGRGRTKEAEAAAVEAAKIGAQQAAAPRQAELDAQAAGGKAAAEASVKRESAARTKAPQINNVVRGLSRIDAALAGLDGALVNTGPVDQYLVGMTEPGQELEAAVGAIKNDLLALTRVPGVGSQSDLEQRIADLKYPQIGFHPEVNRRNLEQLRAFIRDVEESIGGSQQQEAPPQSNGWGIQKL